MEYVIYEDEERKVYILWAHMVHNCIFAGSVGELKVVDRGEVIRPESEKDNTTYYLGELFKKEKEYITNRSSY